MGGDEVAPKRRAREHTTEGSAVCRTRVRRFKTSLFRGLSRLRQAICAVVGRARPCPGSRVHGHHSGSGPADTVARPSPSGFEALTNPTNIVPFSKARPTA